MEEEPAAVAIGTFQSISAEADLHLQRRCPHEAILGYTKALELRPEDKHCLIQRARCWILVGHSRNALKDADEALKDDPKYHKGIYIKAEALYVEGDFELALLYFHRGIKLRPELTGTINLKLEFRVGILKSREAINNAIGDPKRIHIKVDDKLRKILHNIEKSEKAFDTTPKLSMGMESRLLEELYEDKVYLSLLRQDQDFLDFPDPAVKELVDDGLIYLNTRVGFWRQQNPLYSRSK